MPLMRAPLMIVFGIVMASAAHAVTVSHSFPKERSLLKGGEWFPYVISKIAPLEWWSFAASASQLRREEYPSPRAYELAMQNKWEFPRFCFSLFRPKPMAIAALRRAVEQYKGDVVWSMHDDCIGAFASQPTFYTPQYVQQTNSSSAPAAVVVDASFVQRALRDIPSFCRYLETTLNLTDKAPADFNSQWLTRQGLATSVGGFEDFFEPGSWSAVLTRAPEQCASAVQAVRPDEQALSFGISTSEQETLFRELGADWRNHRQYPVLKDYPLLSRLDDLAGDAVYRPNEVNGLARELSKANLIVEDPSSIRGLDKLKRIAQWAQKLEAGICFLGQ
jgi:hypothetical protein